ncbi:MAG: TRAP transporter substrate-binding protein DctP [Candidatus Eisenbacteria bacterium]
MSRDDRFSSCSGRGTRRGVGAARALLVGAVLAMAACNVMPASAAQPTHLFKVATIAPQGSTWMTLMEELDRRVRQETGGEVGFKFYPSGQQGSDLDVLRKMRSGQIQGGGIAGVGLGEIEPSLRILELPFMFQASEEVALAHQALDPIFAERLRGRGFHLLGWADVGFVYLFSQSAVHTVEELRRQKVWLWEGDPLARTLFEQVGVTPIPLNITDVLTSLQTGIINTVYVTPYACLSLQWFTRVEYMVDLPLTYAIGAVVLDAKAYDRLGSAHKEILSRLAGEIFVRLNQATRAQNEESIAAMLEHRMQRAEPAPAAVTEFKEIGKRVWQTLAGDLYEPELLERLTRVLDDARLAQGSVR